MTYSINKFVFKGKLVFFCISFYYLVIAKRRLSSNVIGIDVSNKDTLIYVDGETFVTLVTLDRLSRSRNKPPSKSRAPSFAPATHYKQLFYFFQPELSQVLLSSGVFSVYPEIIVLKQNWRIILPYPVQSSCASDRFPGPSIRQVRCL